MGKRTAEAVMLAVCLGVLAVLLAGGAYVVAHLVVHAVDAVGRAVSV